MPTWIQEWKIAVQFLTRIPWPEFSKKQQGEFDESVLVRSVRWYPWVGLLIGGILAGVSYVYYAWFPFYVASVLLLITEIFLTGGLHLDGLMDTADGFLSSRDRDRKLEIMKDSRVGAMGVITFVSLFALKGALFVAIGPHYPYILLLMPAVGRMAVVMAIASYPPARREGMGALLAGKLSTSQLFVAGLVLLLPLLLWQVKGFVVLLVCWLAYWLMAHYMNRTLGGLTGDTYGAMVEYIEVVFLLASIGLLIR